MQANAFRGEVICRTLEGVGPVGQHWNGQSTNEKENNPHAKRRAHFGPVGLPDRQNTPHEQDQLGNSLKGQTTAFRRNKDCIHLTIS